MVQLDLSMSYINSIICEFGPCFRQDQRVFPWCKMRGHLSHFLAVLKPPNMSFMKKCFVKFQFSWYWASLHNSSWFYKNSSRAYYAYNLLTHCWQKTDRHCCDFPNSIQLICNINRWKHKPTTPMIPWPILPFLK